MPDRSGNPCYPGGGWSPTPEQPVPSTPTSSDLRAHLSEWLERARGREAVVVTARGVPVARLFGLTAAPLPNSTRKDHAYQLLATRHTDPADFVENGSDGYRSRT